MRIEEGQTVVGDLCDKWRPQVFNEFDKLKTAGLQMAWFWTKISSYVVEYRVALNEAVRCVQ